MRRERSFHLSPSYRGPPMGGGALRTWSPPQAPGRAAALALSQHESQETLCPASAPTDGVDRDHVHTDVRDPLSPGAQG